MAFITKVVAANCRCSMDPKPHYHLWLSGPNPRRTLARAIDLAVMMTGCDFMAAAGIPRPRAAKLAADLHSVSQLGRLLNLANEEHGG